MGLNAAISIYQALHQVRGDTTITEAMLILAKHIKQEVEKSTQSPNVNPTTQITK